jgi:hypothetical protein
LAERERTVEELVADSEHVLYEIEMLAAMHAELDPSKNRGLARGIHNARLESLTIHARALIGFLYADLGRVGADDVIADDYLSEWPTVRPEGSFYLREVKERTDKEVAHITRVRAELSATSTEASGDRLNAEPYGWMTGEAYYAVAQVFAEFIERVPAEKVIDGWHDRARAALPATL